VGCTQEFDLCLKQGETYTLEITEWQDDAKTIPLSNVGYSAKLQIRPTAASPEVWVELVDGDGITLGGADGTIVVRIGADKTDDVPKRGKYDLRLTNDSDPTDARYPLEGSVTVDLRVTRDDE
jgi:hypothetical protein